MNFTINEFASFMIQQQVQSQKEKAAEYLKNMSPYERIMFVLDNAGVSAMGLIIGSILIMVFVILMLVFWKKWNLSRMGYVMITALVIGVRVENPTDIFFSIIALGSGIAALVVSIITLQHVEYSKMKEPLYFMFNGFAMLIMAFPIGGEVPFYNTVVALVAMASSLYFIMAVKFSHGGRKKKNVDEAVINVLNKKRDKNYGKPPWENHTKQG